MSAPARRIGFLNTHPIQYFAPMYAYLNAAPDLEVKAFYLSDYSLRGADDRAFGRKVTWDVDLLAGYEAVFVAGAERREEARGFFSMVAPGLWDAISKAPLDALVVHGHTPAAMLVGIAAAKARGLPVFMRGETHLGLVRSGLKARLREPLMHAFYARLDGVLAIGTANHAFYRAMGVPDPRIFSVPYTVDNARFIEASQLTGEARAERRRFLGVEDDRPIVLYAAKFQDRKRPGDLVRAAAELERKGVSFHLAMVGSGELEGELRALVAELDLASISFPGFVNQAGLPAVYGAADVFVLASENEPWGLGINEAMCAGLPIVTTREVGCAADLVQGGVNGAVIRAGDVAALTAALEPMLRDAALRGRMGAASAQIISRWSYAECLAGIRAALASVGLAAPAEAA
jgi:glycosyltransferase involved in cell wall biosynthesis